MKVSWKKWSVLLCFSLWFLGAHSISFAQNQMKYGAGSVSILGQAVATKEQCLRYLLSVNPRPALTVSPAQLVGQYYEEAEKEGIRADIAFAQALRETGFFRYGGLVLANQNNYCGLGSMGRHATGAWFSNSQLGVRAHIQHILAYSTTRRPRTAIVDPRYDLVKTTQSFGRAKTWEDLNGRWAVPGYDYGQGILNIYRKILTQ